MMEGIGKGEETVFHQKCTVFRFVQAAKQRHAVIMQYGKLMIMIGFQPGQHVFQRRFSGYGQLLYRQGMGKGSGTPGNETGVVMCRSLLMLSWYRHCHLLSF